MGKLYAAVVTLLTLMGMPLFAVMGGLSIVAWLTEDREEMRAVRFIAPNVLNDNFISSPILVTIPLFTFAGYLMAEARTPDRLVRASSALLGWMPGGLAIVCIVANAFFTTMTGGSGVTIVAIGGMLYPVLVKQGYPEKYALGLVTAAGAVGLLFFPSPLVAVYSFIAGVDIDRAYLATLVPGVVLALVLMAHAVLVGIRSKVPRGHFDAREAAVAAWDAKWEFAAPFLVALGMGTGLMDLDEASACAALYVLVVEVYVYRDLTWTDVLRIAKESVGLAGAIIVILLMATALTNYVIQERIPQAILDFFVERGVDTAWEFILLLNVFLFILGVVMDEFSAMLVALPLVMPLAARFGLSPFHLAVMFLLNIEIAYISPPIGVNLYIAAFRFNQPLARVYRVVMPFVWLLTAGLAIFVLFPKLSTFTVDDDIAELDAQSVADGLPPREKWMLECVQEDKNNPRPCSAADKAKWGEDGMKSQEPEAAPTVQDKPATPDPAADEKAKQADDDLMREMMGEGTTSSSGSSTGTGASDNDKLFEEMMK